ncbi:MAG: ribonuclease Z [Thermomicrobiales bacterium]
MIDIMLLGTGAMLPLPGRWLSSVIARCDGATILVDCGEGTQIAWKAQGWGFRRLSAICISHTHADHIAGLPGLLHTVANSGRIEPIDLFGPPGIVDVVWGLRSIAPDLPYDLRVKELVSGEQFELPGGLRGGCVAGEHQLPVLAYRFDLPRTRAFLPDRARELQVPIRYWGRLQRGERVEWDGRTIDPAAVLGPPRRGLAFAVITDTRPTGDFVNLARGVDLLVCEGTYGSDDDRPKAVRNQHMTFREAATIAREAGARELWLTHFSPALTAPESFAGNATEVFPATTIGRAGLAISLEFDDEATASAILPGE